MTSEKPFRPTEIWTPQLDASEELDRSILKVVDDMNREGNPKHLENTIQQLLDAGMADMLTIAYGGNSAIAKPEMIEPAIAYLYEHNGRDIFTSIKVASAKHAWGDQLTLLAKLYMRAAL